MMQSFIIHSATVHKSRAYSRLFLNLLCKLILPILDFKKLLRRNRSFKGAIFYPAFYKPISNMNASALKGRLSRKGNIMSSLSLRKVIYTCCSTEILAAH